MREGSFKNSIVVGRIVVGLLLLLFIMMTPWWFYTGLIVFFLFYFKNYYEAILLALFIDALYGPTVMFSVPLFFTLIAVIMVLLSNPLRDRLSW